ncbi:putative ribosomal protein S26e [Helianthus annuus]|uniref:40S ribosomal protein S26 n=2 Tax=Helianthus annuus TaxID=4232 RepID=A0A9K3E3E3_HELAN|nr:uncharacterized protein LOC110912464 isoform X5 [Helianthus annuus]KAF5766171.1 putative ribosomal protein S26e [Helianthus annuus]KAJ0873305.1 putative ribosomal protein S26e [Helianthus annuus]
MANHMIFGGPLVKTETAEEADELMRVDEKASEVEAEVLSAPPKLVYSKLILRFTRKLLVAVADKWDSHVLVMDKVAPQNWKMFKQRNVRRNKHARGHVKFIRCSNCGKCCPKVSQRRCLCCYFHCWWTWCSQCYCGCLQILHHTIELPDLSQELRCFQTVTCYQVLEKKDAASLSASIFQEK